MELSIPKFSTSPSFNPQLSAPHSLPGFPRVPEPGPPPLFAHQGAAPVIPCLTSCLRLELSLDAPPQETIQSPFLKQFNKPTLPHLGPCLSLELCLGAPPPVSIPHPTFLLAWVPQPRVGHRVTLSALVPSSQEFGFTHTKPFSNFNRQDHQQHSHSLYHPTSLIHVEDRPIPHDTHHTILFNLDLSIDNNYPTTTLQNTHEPSITPTTTLHHPSTCSHQTNHTCHHSVLSPHVNPTDHTYPLVPSPHNLTPQPYLLLTSHHIQLPNYHVSLSIPT